MWGYHTSSAWLWAVIAAAAVAGAGLIALAVGRRRSGPAQAGAAEILGQRLARGDIGQAEYQQRLTVLRTTQPARQRGRWRRSAPIALIAAAAVVAAASLAAAAATATHPPPAGFSGPGAARVCTAPAFAGHTVDVTLSDMGAMMGGRSYPGGMMGDGYYSAGNGAAGSGGWMQMMRLTATPSAVPAGEVSFRVRNAGSLTHELVILPLPPGGAGSQPAGSDGRVSERGSLGEASATCAAGAGEGITPGGTGWVTLHLAAGRYELICNLPGHYAAGMFTELDVQ